MQNRLIFYILGGLIGAIILPILMQSGYIFAIDQALNTHGWVSKIGANNYWIGLVSQVFVYLHIPIWFLEKLLVVLTFSLPIVGIYLYIKSFITEKNTWALFFALSLSIFNPFLYSRFLDGQVNIYVFYALFPLFIYFVKSFFEYKTLTSALILGLWSLLLISTTLHASYFIFFVFLIFTLSYSKSVIQVKNTVKILLGFFIIFCTQLFWVIPFILHSQENSFGLVSQIQLFDSKQQQAFSNIPDNKNIYREILSMRGYWGDYEDRFVPSNNFFKDDSRNNTILFIWFLLALGIIYSYKNKTSDRYIYLALGGLGFILSAGVTNDTIFFHINTLLYEYLPYYSGFREPQKFVIFLILSYIYFGYFGVIAISKILGKYHIQKYVTLLVIFFCAIAPILYNFNMLFGFRGQISVQQYPEEWDQVQDYFKQSDCGKCDYQALIFPWHGYMNISWTHKTVGSWITRYFGAGMLIGDTIEIGEVYSSSVRDESKLIEKYFSPFGLFRGEDISSQEYNIFTQDIQKIGIKKIVLLKEVDYLWYKEILDDMLKENLLENVLENDMIQIYKIK